uniref:Alpha/beta hydrolase fold-3 domain-containing protein n=1 Tax=Oryza barthii TaxID=65489 RepID=A0A0D3EJR6_9ORYZ
MSGHAAPAPHVVEDYRGVIQLLSDGTVVRSDAGAGAGALLPPEDFPDVPGVHSDAVVLSADYRLGPEHRLPAAIDDGAAVLSWLRDQAMSGPGADSWLTESADFSRVFVAGESAGGNMSHHVAVLIGSGQLTVDPLRVAGYMLLTPFFGGVERAPSEAEPPAGAFFTPDMSDKLWRLSLPEGATRDHPVANPFGPDSPSLAAVAFPPVLVVVAGRDILHDRTVHYAARLKEMEKPVELVTFEEEKHLFLSLQPWSEPANERGSESTYSLMSTMSGSGDNAAPHVVEDFYGVVKLLSDGSVVRGDESVLIPSLPYQDDVPGGVQWKDVVYDATHGLRVRVYTPRTAAAAAAGDDGGKLPVLVYFHGGGYCIGALDQSICHGFCLRAAYELPAVVLSVHYLLAPEHRLPAAIDDGAAFISWLRGQAALGAGADPWLAESADFARTFISGLSAGANLAHHVTARVASGQLAAVDPARFAGYVLVDPFLAGVERTAAEANPPADVSTLTGYTFASSGAPVVAKNLAIGVM